MEESTSELKIEKQLPSNLVKLKEKKFQLVVNDKISSFRSILNDQNYVEREFIKEGDPYILGDYGQLVDEAKDYQFGVIFSGMGIKDSNGDILTVNKIRELVKHQESNREFHFKDESGNNEILVDFFSSRSDINFELVIKKISSDSKKMVAQLFDESLSNKISKLLAAKFEGVFVENIDISDVSQGELAYAEQEKLERLRALGVNIDLIDNGDKSLVVNFNKETLGRGEKPNQFLESETAYELMDILDKVGLDLSERMESCVMEYGNKFSSRYGNGLAEMYRQLGYLMKSDHDSNRMEQIFSNYNADRMDILVSVIHGTWQMKEANRIWLGMVCQMAGVESIDKKEYPKFSYFQSDLGLKGNGACEDGESYMLIPTEKRDVDGNFIFFYNRPGASDEVNEDYLMAMNLSPIIVGNILLPSGYFCRVSSDGLSVEPVRLSMFGVPEDEARDGFGSQYIKVVKTDGSNFQEGRRLINVK